MQQSAVVSRKPRAPIIGTGPRSPGRLVHHAHLRLRHGLVQALERGGLTLKDDEFVTLAVLGEGPLSQLEIGARLARDRAYTSRVVDALEEQGLVVRNVTDEDRRLKRVALTSEGRSVRARAKRLVDEFLQGVFEGVEPPDYDAFMRVLDHILTRVETKAAHEHS
jgi:MarR family transcriptional regulator for hemolysin